MEHLETYYTTEQVAERLNVAPKTLANWRLTDTGPKYVKVGRQVRYPESELAAYFEALRSAAAESNRLASA